MNVLARVNLIKKMCKKHGITAYEISKGTELSQLGIQNILTGKTKKPSDKTVNTILDYIEKTIVGTNRMVLNEESVVYMRTKKQPETIESKMAAAVISQLKPILDDINNKLNTIINENLK